MAAQHDLAMGAHDETKWSEAHVESFTRFVRAQSALAGLLADSAARDQQTLASMNEPTG